MSFFDNDGSPCAICREHGAPKCTHNCPNPVQLSRPFFEPANWGGGQEWTKGMTTDFEEAKFLAERNRDLLCDNYDRCLTMAAAENWRNFGCVECPRGRVRRPLMLHPTDGVIVRREPST